MCIYDTSITEKILCQLPSLFNINITEDNKNIAITSINKSTGQSHFVTAQTQVGKITDEKILFRHS
jgi:hypothetical protein